ncbi:MAG: hypothetical protein ACD_74C00090G0002 [uncultured bacterium]|nr:MAG: hypothetical protein ACD_74C00090G0002 [uncultured bacterium]
MQPVNHIGVAWLFGIFIGKHGFHDDDSGFCFSAFLGQAGAEDGKKGRGIGNLGRFEKELASLHRVILKIVGVEPHGMIGLPVPRAIFRGDLQDMLGFFYHASIPREPTLCYDVGLGKGWVQGLAGNKQPVDARPIVLFLDNPESPLGFAHQLGTQLRPCLQGQVVGHQPLELSSNGTQHHRR